MRLILTRHGQTVENVNDIMQGWLPGELSDKGKEQAKKVAERLKDRKIDIAYSSDLKRCVETAKEILKYHKELKLRKIKELREHGKGEFEGKKHDEVDWDSIPGDRLNKKIPGGESFLEMYERIKRFYDGLLKKYNDEVILIIGHGGSLCILIGLITGLNLEESLDLEKQANTAISEIELTKKGNFKIICLNC